MTTLDTRLSTYLKAFWDDRDRSSRRFESEMLRGLRVLQQYVASNYRVETSSYLNHFFVAAVFVRYTKSRNSLGIAEI